MQPTATKPPKPLSVEERLDNVEKSVDSIAKMLQEFYREARPSIVGHIAATNEVLKSFPMPQPPYWTPDDSDPDGVLRLNHGDYVFDYSEYEVHLIKGENVESVGSASSLEAATKVVENHKKAQKETSEQ